MIDPGWAVLKTRPRHELLAATAVGARHVEAYVPLIQTKAEERTRPLFAGYLFARVSDDRGADNLERVRSAPGVAYLLTRGGPPAIVAQGVVDMVRNHLAKWPCGQPTAELQGGNGVQLAGGPFRWMETVFDLRLTAASRICVLVEIAYQAVSWTSTNPI